jgi:hypothetical protein
MNARYGEKDLFFLIAHDQGTVSPEVTLKFKPVLWNRNWNAFRFRMRSSIRIQHKIKYKSQKIKIEILRSTYPRRWEREAVRRVRSSALTYLLGMIVTIT